MKAVFIHPTALVETKDIGAGSRVWAYAHVMQGARVGRNCNVGDHCFIESGVRIGDNVTIKNGNAIWDGVSLADGVFVGPTVVFTNDLWPRSPRLPEARRWYNDSKWLVPTRVERGASLGAGAVIIAGVTIGEYAMVAAGALVTKSVPCYALVKGEPARVSGWVCRCGKPLHRKRGCMVCAQCGLEFREAKGDVRPVEQ